VSSADLADAGAAGGAVDPAAPEPELRHGVPVSWSRGQQVLHPSIEQYRAVAVALHDEGFLMCADLTAADYLTFEPDRALPEGVVAERFELVVTLLRFSPTERIRLRVQVPADAAWVPSLFERFPGTDAMEREVFDMFGIGFEGHPDLTRILMPEDWVGHPLRKDFSSGRIPVQFKDAPSAR
jgi:NADH-quinone oxidoreductase subunit C